MKIILAFIILLLSTLAASAAGTIVLVVDASSSMSIEQLDLQMNSYSHAMRELRVLENINIEVVVFSSMAELISSGSRHAAAQAFDQYPRIPGEYRGSTCLTRALGVVEAMVPTLPKPVIIDISGDGEANCEIDPTHLIPTLDRLAAQNVKINTLYIDNNEHHTDIDALEFYKSLTRNGGFTIEANNFFDFERALFEKLILEITQLESLK